MATIAKSVTSLKQFGDRAQVVAWEGLDAGDDGDPFEMPGASDRSVHIKGNFGSGGVATLKGSNDGVTFVTLTDPQGTPISFSAEALVAVSELTRYVRPELAGGTSPAVDVYLLAKR